MTRVMRATRVTKLRGEQGCNRVEQGAMKCDRVYGSVTGCNWVVTGYNWVVTGCNMCVTGFYRGVKGCNRGQRPKKS